jgi:hypothetical protein
MAMLIKLGRNHTQRIDLLSRHNGGDLPVELGQSSIGLLGTGVEVILLLRLLGLKVFYLPIYLGTTGSFVGAFTLQPR